jgi:hypothetical protein
MSYRRATGSRTDRELCETTCPSDRETSARERCRCGADGEYCTDGLLVTDVLP